MVGIDEEGQTGQAVCPNCGQRGLDGAPAIECGGDRVLVQKFLYDFRRPSAGRSPCFISPASPARPMSSAWWACPGKSIRINGGDIFVDGKIVRKSLPEIRAMRILVHDSRFQPQDAKRFPRWEFRSRIGAIPLPPAAGSHSRANSPTQPRIAPIGRVLTGWSTNTGTRRTGDTGRSATSMATMAATSVRKTTYPTLGSRPGCT